MQFPLVLGSAQLAGGPARFTRVHRSILVSIKVIVQLEPILYGEFEVQLRVGFRLMVISRSSCTNDDKCLEHSLYMHKMILYSTFFCRFLGKANFHIRFA